jgi:hypothetical protein
VSGGREAHWSRWAEPGDVLLIEGRNRVSAVIRYLTQSTWSHACLVTGMQAPDGPLIEAELDKGVVASPYEKYHEYNARLCRPVGLREDERRAVIEFAASRVGVEYDLRNVLDLARYFIPLPFPAKHRRGMITFGSGEPTRAICSSVIAEAFQNVSYPILPLPWWESDDPNHRRVIYQVRRYSSYTPRDFDLSPYFEVVKPALRRNFDFHELEWRTSRASSEDDRRLSDTAG